MNEKKVLTPEQVLSLIPQQRPFRFIDRILELDENRIVGKYTFREDEFFYKGHFPGNPITPGVILVESMGQVGVVGLGIYLLSQELSPDEVRKYTSLFVDAELEFLKGVLPGQTVIIRGDKIFWRRMKLRTKVEMIFEDGTPIARGTLSGMGVKL